MFPSAEEQSKRFPESLFVHRRLFFRRSFMGTELNFGASVSRRSFLPGSALFVGAGALSLEPFIPSCSSTPTTSRAAPATADSLPPSIHPCASYLVHTQ